MTKIQVRLADRTYPVVIGRGTAAGIGRSEAGSFWAERRRIFLVSDRTVWRLHGTVVEQAAAANGLEILGRQLIEPGEQHKDLASASAIWDALVDAGVERRDCLVAFGGGVVGDLAGFAAATYLRGIDFVQVPTTLLAMVDSSVGGKTGVDHARGKNLIGAFHQPRAVVADLDFLGTLPRREAVSGFAEVIKAALLGDGALFEVIEKQGPAILEQPVELEQAIGRAVALKARVVERDETEAGPRALLNLGHTLGHAAEVAAGYGVLSHGEAVAFGMGFAVRLSAKLGLVDAAEQERILELLENWGYPLRIEGVSSEKILEALRHDKKSREGSPRWVVLRGIGRAEWGTEVPAAQIRTLLEEVQGSP